MRPSHQPSEASRTKKTLLRNSDGKGRKGGSGSRKKKAWCHEASAQVEGIKEMGRNLDGVKRVYRTERKGGNVGGGDGNGWGGGHPRPWKTRNKNWERDDGLGTKRRDGKKTKKKKDQTRRVGMNEVTPPGQSWAERDIGRRRKERHSWLQHEIQGEQNSPPINNSLGTAQKRRRGERRKKEN